MNILFINANLSGHINPTLALVRKLTEQGHRVSYFCSEAFSEQINRTGASHIGFHDRLEQFLKEYRPTDRHPFYMLMEYILLYDEAMLPDILDIIDEGQYDMVICDSIFGGGSFLKQLIRIPVVCSHSSFAMSHVPVPERMLVPGFHPQLDNCYRILSRICEAYKLKEPSLEEIFISKGDLNIVYTSCNFNGDEGTREPDYIFIGPSIDRVQEGNDVDFLDRGNRKLLYISLGSVNTDFIDFYKMCISAFKDSNYYVCMSIGKKCEVSQLGEIPLNFHVGNYMPQLEILEHADAFITHAGFNSVNEALYFGVPMLALPLVNDQHKVAKRLTAMRLGVAVDMKELSPEILRSQLEMLTTRKEIKESCMRISQEMKEAVRPEEAVRKMEKCVAEWKSK